MMADFKTFRGAELMREAVHSDKHEDYEDFTRYLKRSFQNGTNGSSEARIATLQESMPIAMADRTTALGGQTAIASSNAPWNDLNMGADIVAGFNAEETITVGSVVSVSPGGVAQLVKPREVVTKRHTPIGVVHARSGEWLRVRLAGRTMIQMDSSAWSERRDIWLSETSNGCGSFIMPRTARNGIMLLGVKQGALRGNMAEAILHGPIYPARWERVWEFDSDNYIDREFIAIRGGFWRLTFVVGGQAVAILDETRLYIQGSFVANPYTSDTTDTPTNSRLGQIEYVHTSTLDSNVGAMGFQVPHSASGTYTRVAELNGNGDFLVGSMLNGGFPIGAANSADFSGAFYGTTGGNVDLSLDGVQAWMRFERYASGSPVNAYMEVDSVAAGVLPG